MSSRILILIILLIGIDAYSYQWFKQLFPTQVLSLKIIANIVFWLGTLISIFLFVTYFSGASDKLPNQLLVYLRAFAFISYFAKFVSLPIMLIDDIRRGAGYVIKSISPTYAYNPSRSRFLSTLGAAVAGIPFFTLFYGMARNAYRYTTHKIKIPVKNLHPSLEGLRIVQISDIHSGSFTAVDPIRKSIDIVNKLKPDLLFFTGDLVNYKADEVEPYLDIFSQMKGKYGSFSIFGNHDNGDYAQWSTPQSQIDNLEKRKNHHKEIGWDLLLNRHQVVEINGQKNQCYRCRKLFCLSQIF
ncbi:MAG: metallophosphoesterase [Saprospiraceae bacterium]|nr:metallophosphoesterase [Saprospiraceae bacterium]